MARTGDTIIPLPTAATAAARRERRFLDTFNALSEPQQRVMEALLRVRVVINQATTRPGRAPQHRRGGGPRRHHPHRPVRQLLRASP